MSDKKMNKSERRAQRNRLKKNTQKDKHLSTIPQVDIEAEGDNLTQRCKFNYSYFHVSEINEDYPERSQTFKEWEKIGILSDLCEKLKEHSKYSLEELSKKPIGKKGGHVLEYYPLYPPYSKLKKPLHVPIQAVWTRIRLSNNRRLIGFTIPKEYQGKEHTITEVRYDCNTFYVVFLDKDHKFWSSN